MMRQMYLVNLIGMAIFFTVGFVCAFFANRIQSFAVDYCSRAYKANKFNIFLPWMKSKTYVVFLRIVGTLMIVCSLILVYLIYIRPR